VTIEVEAPRAPTPSRLSARSSIAIADIELARHTLVDLQDAPIGFEDAGARVLSRIRRLVVGNMDTLDSRS